MPSFTYRGDPREYPALSLRVEDGEVVDFPDAAPDDGRWTAAATTTAAPAAEPAPAPVAEAPVVEPAQPTAPNPTKD